MNREGALCQAPWALGIAADISECGSAPSPVLSPQCIYLLIGTYLN